MFLKIAYENVMWETVKILTKIKRYPASIDFSVHKASYSAISRSEASLERFILNKSMLALTYLPVIFQVLTNSLSDFCSSTFPGTEVKMIPLQDPDSFFFPFLKIDSVFTFFQALRTSPFPCVFSKTIASSLEITCQFCKCPQVNYSRASWFDNILVGWIFVNFFFPILSSTPPFLLLILIVINFWPQLIFAWQSSSVVDSHFLPATIHKIFSVYLPFKCFRRDKKT